MPWIVYETTNLKNGKKYVGVHKQDGDGFDGYIGSGGAIKAAKRKYGRDNFERRTLFVFSSAEEAYACEAEIVTIDWCARKDTYNQTTGGMGGQQWGDPEYRDRQCVLRSSVEYRSRMSASVKASRSDPEYRKKQSELTRAAWENNEIRKKHCDGMKAYWNRPETRERRSGVSKKVWSDASRRERLSVAVRKALSDPAAIAKKSKESKKRWADPCFRRKATESMKAAWARKRVAKAAAMLVVIQDAHVSQTA